MKILLTGMPKSGKSTMLASLIVDVDSKRGLSSPEVRENGQRIGFDLQDEHDRTAILSRVDTITDYPVGRYYVDLASFEQFIKPLFKYEAQQLLFIDEVGQMQLYSERFEDLTGDYLDAPNDFIGTISLIYDHPFIHQLRNNTDILLCEVTPENREQLKAALIEALNHRAIFNALPKTRQHTALDLARGYLTSNQYVSLKKLFKNAIPYVSTGKVDRGADGFTVRGNTNSHLVHILHGDLVCDCDFFNGRGQFANNAGECSHIQSVKLFSS